MSRLFRFIKVLLVSKTKAIELAKFLEESGHVYSTVSEDVFFPTEIRVPGYMVETVYNFIANADNAHGVSNGQIISSSGCKFELTLYPNPLP